MATKPTKKPAVKAAPKAEPKTPPKKTSKAPLKPELKEKLERITAQPMKRAPEQIKEQFQQQEAEPYQDFPEQEQEQFSKTFPEEHEPLSDVPPELDESSANTLAILRKVLDSHELLDYIPDCEIKIDSRSLKDGNVYRLYLDDNPSQLSIALKGGRCSVGGKYYPGPAEAGRALCDMMVAQFKGASRRK
jgi:hypothetical protein